MVPREIAALVEFLSSREGWHRVNYGDGPAWACPGVVVTVSLDEEVPNLECWSVEVEVGPEREVVDVDLLAELGGDDDPG